MRMEGGVVGVEVENVGFRLGEVGGVVEELFGWEGWRENGGKVKCFF